MTHTPPVPAGNRSPYPLHEAPHVASRDAPPPGDVRVAKTPEAKASSSTLIGIAAGIGLAAIAGGLFFALRGSPKPQPKKRRRKAKA